MSLKDTDMTPTEFTKFANRVRASIEQTAQLLPDKIVRHTKAGTVELQFAFFHQYRQGRNACTQANKVMRVIGGFATLVTAREHTCYWPKISYWTITVAPKDAENGTQA